MQVVVLAGGGVGDVCEYLLVYQICQELLPSIRVLAFNETILGNGEN